MKLRGEFFPASFSFQFHYQLSVLKGAKGCPSTVSTFPQGIFTKLYRTATGLRTLSFQTTILNLSSATLAFAG